jgi:hypothetical protein
VALCSLESSILITATQRNISEDSILHLKYNALLSISESALLVHVISCLSHNSAALLPACFVWIRN